MEFAFFFFFNGLGIKRMGMGLEFGPLRMKNEIWAKTGAIIRDLLIAPGKN